MLFSSSLFLFLFLPLVLLVYYLPLRRWRQGQNVFLLAASLLLTVGFSIYKEPILYAFGASDATIVLSLIHI